MLTGPTRRLRFLISEGLGAIADRPLRATIALVCFILASGGIMASFVVGTSAAGAVRATLTPDQLDTVRLRPVESGPLTEAELDHLRAVRGVTQAAAQTLVFEQPQAVAATPLRTPGALLVVAPIVAADARYFAAADGRATPQGIEHHLAADWASDIALVGGRLAEQLQVGSGGPGRRVWIGSTSFDIVGIIDNADRDESLARSVLIAPAAIPRLAGTEGQAQEVIVRTSPGAAGPISEIAPLALRPATPDTVRVSTVLDLQDIRRGVTSTLTAALGILALVMCGLAAVALASTTLVSVVNRRPEIGLRRCLGSSRWSVAALFLAEGAVLGLIGGLCGSALGAAGGTAAARGYGWTPVVDPIHVLIAPCLAVLIGVVACALPAWLATRIPPAIAVRAA